MEFHLICRVSQFVENLGNCLQACWFSPKNCNRDAIKSLKNCQTEIEWLLELLQIKNIPFLTHSVIVAFNLISKAGSRNNVPCVFSMAILSEFQRRRWPGRRTPLYHPRYFLELLQSIDFDDEHDLASELEMIARPIVQSLLETLESFDQLKIQTVPQLHQGLRFIN